MKHYTKAILGVALLSSSLMLGLSGEALAEGSIKGVVTDKYGNPVRSILSGKCVRTKWDVAVDLCAKAQPMQAAPMYVAPQPQRAVMKEYIRSYLVFFDFDKSTLSTGAREIINNLYSYAKQSKKKSFVLTGYADRAGTEAYNMELSKRRALTVKNELVRLGINSDYIRISWRGENDPLVPTKDGIMEPQNRRAAIKMMIEISE